MIDFQFLAYLQVDKNGQPLMMILQHAILLNY